MGISFNVHVLLLAFHKFLFINYLRPNHQNAATFYLEILLMILHRKCVKKLHNLSLTRSHSIRLVFFVKSDLLLLQVEVVDVLKDSK